MAHRTGPFGRFSLMLGALALVVAACGGDDDDGANPNTAVPEPSADAEEPPADAEEPPADAEEPPADAEEPSLEQPSIRIATIPVDTAAQAFYADAEGMFEDVGLDVEIEIVQDPTQLAAAVLSGDAQFSLTSAPNLAILVEREAGLSMGATGALYRPDAPTTALVVGADSGITSSADLTGKVIAIDQRNSAPDVALQQWLEDEGVDIESVTLREMPFATMLGPLGSGAVDAAVLPEPFLTISAAQGATVLDTIFDSVCTDDCLLTAWIVADDWAADNPQTLAAYREAMAAASEWANDEANLERSGEILGEYAPLEPEVISQMERAQYGTQLAPDLVQPWIDVMAKYGVFPSAFPATDLVVIAE